jgi:ubiquitin-protein ligase
MSNTRNLAAILNGNFNKAVKAPNEYVLFSRDLTDHNVWYILIRNITGDNEEFTGGQYIFKMWAPDDFPFHPPRFYALTENGVYQIGKECCVDGGKWHSDRYRPVEGMAGFAEKLMSGLIGWDYLIENGGINLIEPDFLSAARRNKAKKPHVYEEAKLENANRIREFAINSIAFNEAHNSAILALIEDQYAIYSAKWDTSKLSEEEKARLSFRRVTF